MEEEDFCSHIELMKGKSIIDSHGVKRIVAEEVGTEEPGSVVFIEASWLTEPPAFGGAVRRHILPIPEDNIVEIQMPIDCLEREAVKMWLNL
jgi:hypothetical protein